jgi:hypothetical protein
MKSQIGKVFKWSKKREKRRTEYKSLPVGGEAAYLKKAVKEEDKKQSKMMLIVQFVLQVATGLPPWRVMKHRWKVFVKWRMKKYLNASLIMKSKKK